MKTRLLLGTTLVAGVLLLLYADNSLETRVGGSLLIVVLALLGWYELAVMTGATARARGGGRGQVVVGVLAMGYFLGLHWWHADGASWKYLGVFPLHGFGEALAVGLGATVFGGFFVSLFREDHQAAYHALVGNLMGVLLLGVLFPFCLALYHLERGALVAVVAFIGIKGNDISAYLVGRAIGRVRFLKVSPKKTLEGCSAALVFSVLFFVSVGFAWPGEFFPWPQAIGAGIILSITTQAGDLSESLIKRTFDVKDSGALLPEFGGVLDMVDSMLFSSVAFWFLLSLR